MPRSDQPLSPNHPRNPSFVIGYCNFSKINGDEIYIWKRFANTNIEDRVLFATLPGPLWNMVDGKCVVDYLVWEDILAIRATM